MHKNAQMGSRQGISFNFHHSLIYAYHVRMNTPLILASASPRRKKILTEMGLNFQVLIPDVEEILYLNDPTSTAKENAILKHIWCRDQYPNNAIITADTVLDFNGRCIGKPSSIEEAHSFLRMLSGKTHVVITGVALSTPEKKTTVQAISSTVTFKELDDDFIKWYFTRLDPTDRAGAYDIDEHGNLLIESLSGSKTNVMGLPKETIKQWLNDL